MSGSQNIGESSDNPVEINVVAMVDVIFCLCLFFMCSMHFKQLEGKIDSWLPNRGSHPTPVDKVVLEEIRVFMKWDVTSGATIRKVGNRGVVGSDQELMQIVLSMKADYDKVGKSEFPVLIDATGDVPWSEVIHVMDLCKGENIKRIEFAAPFE